MADDTGRAFFDTLTTYRRIQNLIDSGEAESQYLECKAPTAPQLGRDLKATLAEAASGFANAGGGVILWGVATSRHPHSSSDILSQIVPVGSIKSFIRQVDLELPRLTMPQLSLEQSRILLRSRTDTRGVAATYIPRTEGNPVQSTIDRNFYIRTGDEFRELPYEALQRMFAGARRPALRPFLSPDLITTKAEIWDIPTVLTNESAAVARDVCVAVTILNPDACEEISSVGKLKDQSSINPGSRTFVQWMDRPCYNGIHLLTGSLRVKMRRDPRPRRSLQMRVELFADHMQPRYWTFRVHLTRQGFAIRDVQEGLV